MSIKYSVLVPVYNVEKYIRDCIESVLGQTYKNFELILVDDGSPDKSGTICDEYAKNDSRIRVFHKSNQGSLHTRIDAIERASGDYYVFLDSDDMIKRNALEIINAKIQKYSCDCLIYGYEQIEEGKALSQVCDAVEEVLCEKKDIYRKVFFSTAYNSLCRKAVKATVFHGIDYSPYYHLNYSEDLLQSLEIYKYSKTIAFIPDVLYEYRMNPTSITHNSDKRIIDYTIRKKTLEFLINEAVFTKDDYDQYRDFCIGMVTGDLIRLSMIHKNYSYIIKKMTDIRNDSYYQDFLKIGITNRKMIGVKSVIFNLFKHDKIIFLVLLVRFGYCLKRINPLNFTKFFASNL